MRKPVAAFAVSRGDASFQDVQVVCDDGSVWELSSDEAHVSNDNEFGWFWYQLPAIPGSEVDR